MYELTVEDTFNAAHQLIGYGGACEKLHGHTWKVAITIEGKKLNKTGILVDFKEIKKKLKGILDKLDHNFLNKIPYFKKINPSAENIAKYIYKKLKIKNACPSGRRVKFKKVSVWESEGNCASYYE